MQGPGHGGRLAARNPPAVEHRVQTSCLVVLTAIALAAALYWLRPVMIPFVLSVFIALGLQPLISIQVERLRMPRSLALLSTLALGVLMLMLLGALISASVSQLSANADVYARQLTRLIERVVAALPQDMLGDLAPDDVVPTLVRIPVKSIGGMLVGTTNAIVDVLSKSLLVLIFVSFLLIGGSGGTEATGVWREAETRIKRFLVTKAVISAATGLLVGSVLTLLDIDLALVFGLFAFLLNFIPSIGSIVATLLPLPVVLVSPDVSTPVAVAAIAVPGALQFAIGNVLEPRVMGSSLDLHPVAILLALIFWGMLWGIVGMLLATPITAVLKIVLERFEGTRLLADLIAGRLDALRSPSLAPAPDA